jgi:hypothetical protein
MNNHMRNVVMAGKDDIKDCHPNFRILRLDQDMNLGWINEDQLRTLVEKEIAHREKTGTQYDRF